MYWISSSYQILLKQTELLKVQTSSGQSLLWILFGVAIIVIMPISILLKICIAVIMLLVWTSKAVWVFDLNTMQLTGWKELLFLKVLSQQIKYDEINKIGLRIDDDSYSKKIHQVFIITKQSKKIVLIVNSEEWVVKKFYGEIRNYFPQSMQYERENINS